MADDNVVKLKIDGETYELDMADLTLAEVGVVEDLTGKSVQELDWESARGMQGMVWIALSRRNPRFTIEDAGRIKFSSFSEPEEERPTKGAGDKARAKSGASTS